MFRRFHLSIFQRERTVSWMGMDVGDIKGVGEMKWIGSKYIEWNIQKLTKTSIF